MPFDSSPFFRAFQFGLFMRLAANALFEGSLSKALIAFATPDRVEQHFRDLAAMPLRLRPRYSAAILAADRSIVPR